MNRLNASVRIVPWEDPEKLLRDLREIGIDRKVVFKGIGNPVIGFLVILDTDLKSDVDLFAEHFGKLGKRTIISQLTEG